MQHYDNVYSVVSKTNNSMFDGILCLFLTQTMHKFIRGILSAIRAYVKTGSANCLAELVLYLLLSAFVQFVGPVTTKLRSSI